MIAFFPKAYPDELLYSQLARYYVRSGYAKYVFAVTDLYKNETAVHPSVEFVNQYTTDAKEWITRTKPWETVLAEHTMYPAYIRFLPRKKREEALQGLVSCTGNWRNLMCIPVLREQRYIRYCPVCSKEDRETYSETYWHREHQIRRIRVCPKHRCFLENSTVIISSKSSPGLFDAESRIPKVQEAKPCDDEREIAFTQYVVDVFRRKVDMQNTLAVGAFLHSRLTDAYVNASGLLRNMVRLYEAYTAFYGNGMPVMTQTYMQKIFNGYQFDPYFVLQIAYFEGVSVQDVTHLPKGVPLSGMDRLYEELSEKHSLDSTIVADIGNTVLKYASKGTRISEKSGPKGIAYDALDAKHLPQVKAVVKRILSDAGRPEKLSFAKVQKIMGLPPKQLNKLPRCKAYIERHMESQAQFWAREVEWAVGELQRQNKSITLSKIMKLTNMRKKDVWECVAYMRDANAAEMLHSLQI